MEQFKQKLSNDIYIHIISGKEYKILYKSKIERYYEQWVNIIHYVPLYKTKHKFFTKFEQDFYEEFIKL